MIDEDTRQAVADGPVEQDGSNAGVYTAGESEDDTVVAQLGLEFGHRAVYKGCCRPLLARAADVDDEVLQQLGALQGVEHLRVELDSPNTS